jgi:hypothetical protein
MSRAIRSIVQTMRARLDEHRSVGIFVLLRGRRWLRQGWCAGECGQKPHVLRTVEEEPEHHTTWFAWSSRVCIDTEVQPWQRYGQQRAGVRRWLRHANQIGLHRTEPEDAHNAEHRDQAHNAAAPPVPRLHVICVCFTVVWLHHRSLPSFQRLICDAWVNLLPRLAACRRPGARMSCHGIAASACASASRHR